MASGLVSRDGRVEGRGAASCGHAGWDLICEGPDLVGSLDDGGHQARFHMPVDVAVEEPHPGVVRVEDDLGPAQRRDRHHVPQQVEGLVERLCLGEGAGGHHPEAVAVDMERVLAVSVFSMYTNTLLLAGSTKGFAPSPRE